DPVQLFLGLAAHVAHGDLGILALGSSDLDHLAAPLLGHLRQVDPQLVALVVGVDTEVRVAQRLLHGVDLAVVVRLDDRHPRLGHRDRCHLGQRRRGAVVVDDDLGEHSRRRATGTDRREVFLRVLDRPLHLLLGLEECVVDHLSSPLSLRPCHALLGFARAGGGPGHDRRQAVVINVPIFSPLIARMSVSSPSDPNTSIGSLLSRHRASAAVSMTRRPSRTASSNVTDSSLRALGSVRGSAVYTPSTPFLLISTISAWISSARWAATVSVLKYGMPAPAPKITTRPFSRCRIARRGIYGSATCAIVIADCTRVSTPSFSRKSCSA